MKLTIVVFLVCVSLSQAFNPWGIFKKWKDEAEEAIDSSDYQEQAQRLLDEVNNSRLHFENEEHHRNKVGKVWLNFKNKAEKTLENAKEAIDEVEEELNSRENIPERARKVMKDVRQQTRGIVKSLKKIIRPIKLSRVSKPIEIPEFIEPEFTEEPEVFGTEVPETTEDPTEVHELTQEPEPEVLPTEVPELTEEPEVLPTERPAPTENSEPDVQPTAAPVESRNEPEVEVDNGGPKAVGDEDEKEIDDEEDLLDEDDDDDEEPLQVVEEEEDNDDDEEPLQVVEEEEDNDDDEEPLQVVEEEEDNDEDDDEGDEDSTEVSLLLPEKETTKKEEVHEVIDVAPQPEIQGKLIMPKWLSKRHKKLRKLWEKYTLNNSEKVLQKIRKLESSLAKKKDEGI